MTLPRRSWPFLALAGLGACVLAVHGCVSVARAAEDLDTASMGGWGMGGAGGIGGGVLVLAMMLLRDEIKSRREAKQSRDDEPTGAYRPVLTRGEVEAMIDRSAKDLRDRMDEQHRRVNERDRDREAHILRVDAAQSDLRLQIAGRLASAEADLKTLIREASR